MLSKSLYGMGMAAVFGCYSVQPTVSECLGRVDPAAWEAEHPSPPSPPARPGPEDVEIVETRRIVPSEGLPAEAAVQIAHNNLDVVRHRGRVYLAFRSAPSHFAGTQTTMEVVSSEDEKTWRFEGRLRTGFDLREPRFLSLGDRLFLYVSRLGKDPFDFEPHGVSVAEIGGGGVGPLETLTDDGSIFWRARQIGGAGVVVSYRGGENLYSIGTSPVVVDLLKTTDGRRFEPFDSAKRSVLVGGASETDFALFADGSLFAVARNEAGDEMGWGSKICTAPAGHTTTWSCRAEPKKYDSPFVFTHRGEAYLVARRNRTGDGRYDVGAGPRPVRALRNQVAYITEAKRCSLFHYDRAAGELGFVLDLPSRGDTCFPAVLDGANESEHVVYDYSSDIDGPDLPWAAGQRRPTYVYRHVLRFRPRS